MRRGIRMAVAGVSMLAAGCAGTVAAPVNDEPQGSQVAKEYSERHGIPYYETDPYQYPYHPCVEIPDDVLIEAGLDPETADADIAGAPVPGWRICSWSGSAYRITVWTSAYTLDDLYQDAKHGEFRDVTVNGRKAVVFRAIADTERRTCSVGYSAPPGMVWIDVGTVLIGRFPEGETPCTLAPVLAARFEPYLPQ